MSKKRIVICGYAGSTHIYKWSHSLLERDFEVRIISLGDVTLDGIDVVRFQRNSKLSYYQHASKAKNAILEFNPDIVHVHYAGGYGIWGLKSDFHPLIVSVWGSDINKLANSFFYKNSIRSLLKKADHITATSASLQSAVQSFEKTTREKTTVIPFGVKIPSEVSDLRNKINHSAVYLKQLEPVYAPDILIRATAQVVQKYQDFRLTIAGTGSLEQELRALTKQLGLNDSVDIIGWFDNSKIYELITRHDFLVMPSLQEGFGVAAVEAFACCRPVIATNVGGIPEIVSDTVNGYLVEPGNVDALASAMVRMLDDKDKMVQMGLNGYQVAKEKYDWEKSVDLMVNLYNSMLNGRSEPI